MHILLRQLCLEPGQHTRPSSSQRLLTNTGSQHIKTSLILNDSVIFIFKITVTQPCLALLLGERFDTAQLLRTRAVAPCQDWLRHHCLELKDWDIPELRPPSIPPLHLSTDPELWGKQQKGDTVPSLLSQRDSSKPRAAAEVSWQSWDVAQGSFLALGTSPMGL